MQYCVKIILVQGFCPLKMEITQFPEGFLIISCLILKKNYRRFKRLILLHSWTKKKSHLRTSYGDAHLAELAPVVQKMDNPIHSTNLYPVDSAIDP